MTGFKPPQQEILDALATYPTVRVSYSSGYFQIFTPTGGQKVSLQKFNSVWLLHFLIDYDDEVEKYALMQMWSVIDTRKSNIEEGI